MKLAIASPHYRSNRGNKITADRLWSGLTKEGAETAVVSSTDNEPLPGGTELVIGFHAYKFAAYYRAFGRGLPYIVTVTGTDINQDLHTEERGPVVREMVENAEMIHVFDTYMEKEIRTYFPEKEVLVLPQAVTIDPLPRVKSDRFTVFLPAGIREVKDISGAVNALRPLGESGDIRLLLAGPVIEENEMEKISPFLQEEWLEWTGEVPFSEMRELYRKCDVVINHSESEGQSSAVLEAMAFGRPAAVRDIPGNAGVVTHMENGLLYEGEEGLRDAVLLLKQDTSLQEKLREGALKRVKDRHDPEKEAAFLMNRIKRILS
ncbi:glycosyltransferase [Alkalicoccus urumqiensis]|uniref:Glycosyl transferase family 1 domain-containing protein n=1 Tax=Alkalicoccus urumqiensis TaxID=1548213 RepID=A0A2P6ML05_ALKUR|nr:glycosyltransferase [Alkalicoccus urumqiensis]PRO66962.1 hypothetical protein C6I21_03300 [Alkalicoccus urumqiensis]